MNTDKVKPFIVMDILERALRLEKEGSPIIHLEIGEPDFRTPQSIIDEAVESLKKGQTHYTDSRGIIELRNAIASYYSKNYGVNVSEEQVLVTMGSSPGLLLVLSAIIDSQSDEVIIGNPCYPCYPNFINFAGGIPRYVETSEEEGFQLNARIIKKVLNKRTRAVLINSPSNPSGTLIGREDMKEIAGLGVPVISDEIYHGLVYDDKPHSILEFTDNAFVLNGFSKLFAMTGWRLGYIIAPKEFVRKIHVLLQNFFISPNSFVQRAAVTALNEEHPEVEEMKKRYDARRRFLLEKMPELGIKIPVEPKGAFYLFINMSHINKDSYNLAIDILEKEGVAMTPGIDFGSRGEGFLRLSYANSIENISEAVRRLKNYIEAKETLQKPS